MFKKNIVLQKRNYPRVGIYGTANFMVFVLSTLNTASIFLIDIVKDNKTISIHRCNKIKLLPSFLYQITSRSRSFLSNRYLNIRPNRNVLKFHIQ